MTAPRRPDASPHTVQFMDGRRACLLHWRLDEKLMQKGRLNITGEDAAEAIRVGQLRPHPSDRSRYVARSGRLVVVFSAPQACNNYCITVFYQRS